MPAGGAPPSPSAATIAWSWVIEELARCKEFDSAILAAILRRDPSIVADPVYGAGTMECFVLRLLEELVDWVEFPPSSPPPKSATATPVPESKELGKVAASIESVLCPNLQKVGGLDNSDESWRTVLHQFILQKRDASSKTFLDLLKDSILEDCRQGASSSSRFSCLLRGDHVRSLQTDNADDIEIASKKLKLSNSDIQQVKLLSAVPSETKQNLLLKCATSRHEDQLSKENVQIVTDDNDACLTTQNVDPKFPGEKNKRPLGISQMKTRENINITDFPTDGRQNTLSESSSDGEGHYDAAPDFHPNDEILAAEKLKLLNSQNLVNNYSQIGDWTQQRSCIKCDEGGVVLICTGVGCPIAVHESCLGSSVEIENPEDFKCPFCSYLLTASAYYEARKKVSTARKTLSSFMGWGRAGLKKVPPLMTGSSHMRKPSNGNNSDNICANQRSSIVKEPENQAKAAIHGDDDNFHAGEEHHFVDRNGGSIAPSGEKEIGNEYHVISAEQNTAVVNDKLCHADAANSQIRQTDKGSPSQETRDSKPSDRPCSNGHAQELEPQQWANPDPDTLSLQCEAATCENQVECEEVEKQCSVIKEDVDPQNNSKIHGGEYSSRNERKHQTSSRSSKRYTNPMFPYARRNRLPWMHEEEAILREAMQKFYQNGEKSISWIKILEFGRHIFHKTRQPADLKDKWRNIRMREA